MNNAMESAREELLSHLHIGTYSDQGVLRYWAGLRFDDKSAYTLEKGTNKIYPYLAVKLAKQMVQRIDNAKVTEMSWQTIDDLIREAAETTKKNIQPAF